MSDSQNFIISLLEQQLAQLDALLLLLTDELAALVARQVEQLDLVITQKNQLLQEIAALDNTLAQQSELSAIKHEAWFKEAIKLVDQKLADCKAQSAVNQQVLEQSQLTLQRYKNEILGARGKSGLTYTNKGQPAVENKGPGIKA